MGYQKVELFNDTLCIPDYYTRVKDAVGHEFITLIYEGTSAYCLVNLYSIKWNSIVPSKNGLLLGLKQTLSKNQGIVQLDVGKDYNDCIIKSRMVDSRKKSYTQYISTYQEFHDGYINIAQLYTEERNKINARNSEVFFLYTIANNPNFDIIKAREWKLNTFGDCDRKGFPLNKAELKDYDKLYPDHPLTLSRVFLDTIKNGNKLSKQN